MNPETAHDAATVLQLEPDQETQQEAVLNTLDPFSQPFRLGEWLVDPSLNQLQQLDGSIQRHLEPRLAKLLCYLASHPLQVVDRDTLVSVLWPRVIVNENSLTRAVSELRKLLSLEPRPDQVYIETIPKRGYRLCQPVQAPVAASPALDSHSAIAMWQAPAAWQQVRQSAVAAFCLALALAFLLQGYESTDRTVESLPGYPVSDELMYSSTEQQLRDELVPSSILTAGETDVIDAESQTEPVMSRDGERFAFIQYDHTGSTLFLGEMESSFDPVPIFNSSERLFNLTWSPLQDALLFAGKPSLTTTALYDGNLNDQSKLYAFDLESFRLSLLVEEVPTTQPASEAELSLT